MVATLHNHQQILFGISVFTQDCVWNGNSPPFLSSPISSSPCCCPSACWAQMASPSPLRAAAWSSEWQGGVTTSCKPMPHYQQSRTGRPLGKPINIHLVTHHVQILGLNETVKSRLIFPSFYIKSRLWFKDHRVSQGEKAKQPKELKVWQVMILLHSEFLLWKPFTSAKIGFEEIATRGMFHICSSSKLVRHLTRKLASYFHLFIWLRRCTDMPPTLLARFVLWQAGPWCTISRQRP